MNVIGVTGKSGSGKTTFAQKLAKRLNCEYIDIDKIGHEALYQRDIVDDLCEKFGPQILDEDGKVNRKKVGKVVFGQKEKMQELTDLTWDYMQKRLDIILSQNSENIVLEWLLLPKSGKYWERCDSKILVTANDEKRKNKVLERDNISEEYFDKRDAASINYSSFDFDYIFENNYDEQSMNKMIDKLTSQCIGGDER